MSPRRNWDSPTLPPPLPQASMPPPGTKGDAQLHIRLRVRGWGSPNSDDWRKSILPSLDWIHQQKMPSDILFVKRFVNWLSPFLRIFVLRFQKYSSVYSMTLQELEQVDSEKVIVQNFSKLVV
jgi:hypothetical protein